MVIHSAVEMKRLSLDRKIWFSGPETLGHSQHLERRTAITAHEIARNKIDISALSETCFTGEFHLVETCSSYALFWSGRPDCEKHEAGVTFAIKMPLEDHLVEIRTRLGDRLIKLCLRISNSQCATTISPYASTMTNSDETKEKFYEDAVIVIWLTPSKHKLIVLSDFNVQIGRDHAHVIGHHGIGNDNSNDILLMCSTKDYEHQFPAAQQT